MGVHGCAWVCMGIYRCAWVCMGMHGYAWVYMGIHGMHGYIWVCMGMHGYVWVWTWQRYRAASATLATNSCHECLCMYVACTPRLDAHVLHVEKGKGMHETCMGMRVAMNLLLGPPGAVCTNEVHDSMEQQQHCPHPSPAKTVCAPRKRHPTARTSSAEVHENLGSLLRR